MQEEVMEKGKSSTAGSVAAKSAGADQRKVDTQTRHSRYARKKENGLYKAGEPVKSANGGKKPGPQRSRDWVDRRPRARGGPVQQQAYYAESEEVNETEPVLSARPGSRKGSLNHLLNFTFNPRQSPGLDGKPCRKRRTSYKFNKEQFLQANCQFIVCESGDYAIHAADPDKLVDWNLIEQVRVYDDSSMTCPICLYPPVAARITRCGHVYCWSCVLHYLSLDDSAWRKCPICYDAVHRRDLKSVLVEPQHAYQPGQTLTLRLMRKARGSTVISPAEGDTRPADDTRLRTVDACAVERRYSKLLVASADHVTENIINAERRQLIQQKQEHEPDSLEASFIDVALEELTKRQELLGLAVPLPVRVDRPGYQTLYDTGSTVSAANVTSPVDEVGEKLEDLVVAAPRRAADTKLIVYACAFSDEELDPDLPSECATGDVSPPADDVTDSTSGDDVSLTSGGVTEVVEEEVNVEEVVKELSLPSPAEERANSPSAKNKDYFYFYQAEDGQQIYLHSVNARCLMAEYGGLDKCPKTITGRVEALESVSMTGELRRRLRYLNHLPLTCQFRFAQLQLKPPLVSNNTLRAFEGEFTELRRLRQRKARDERRLAQRQDRHDQLKNQMDTFKTTTIVQSAVYQSETPPRQEPTNQRREQERRDSVTSQPDDTPSVPSFAQMLRLPSAAPPPVWPRVTAPPTAPAAAAGTKAESEDEGPSVPTYQDAFSDAFQTALDALDNKTTENKEKTKKNKKPNKKLLFTTTMNRASAL